MSLRLVRNTVRHAIHGVTTDALGVQAAAMAFYSALSLAPLIVLMLWILSLVRPQWQAQLEDALTGVMGNQAAAIVALIVNNAHAHPIAGSVAGLLGAGITLFSASAVFAQLQSTLNQIWNLPASKQGSLLSWLRERLRAFGLALGLAFLLIVSFVISAVIGLLVPQNTPAWAAVEYLVSLLVFAAAFGAMYRILPDASIPWPDAIVGALLTTVLFILGKYAIDWYLQHAQIGGAYGPAGGLVVMLTWSYYVSFVVLLGAELTHGLAMAKQDEKHIDTSSRRRDGST